MPFKFIRQPQATLLRRALLQVHLWAGIGLGAYVVCICLSGSAIVFRVELDKLFCPRTLVVLPTGRRRSDGELAAAARAAHPFLPVDEVQVHAPRLPDAAVEIVLIAGTRRLERLFDPYTAQDLGDTVTGEPAFLTWLVDFHDDLLGGSGGRRVNGWGAGGVLLLCATGAVLWWPGTARWTRSMTLRRNVRWRRFAWDLHSALGFWLMALLLMWAVTGVYFAFPGPFENVVDRFRPAGIDTGTALRLEAAIEWLVRLHFGRTFGPVVKAAWASLGILPAVMFATGVLMWWNRALRRRWRRSTVSRPPLPASAKS